MIRLKATLFPRDAGEKAAAFVRTLRREHGQRLLRLVWNMGGLSEARQQGDLESSGHKRRQGRRKGSRRKRKA